jgi:hypothetical protein
MLFLAAVGFAVSGCSGAKTSSSTSTSTTKATKGTYTLSITGTNNIHYGIDHHHTDG